MKKNPLLLEKVLDYLEQQYSPEIISTFTIIPKHRIRTLEADLVSYGKQYILSIVERKSLTL